MPHIAQKNRPAIDKILEPLLSQDLKIADIEYIVALFIQEYVLHNGLSFNTLKDIDGLFSAGQSEFYRCVTGPYEAVKAEQNGNAYYKLIALIDEMVEKSQ